ncbi:hypothetical protein CANARDRAFT_27954 [[Candida] arabinofermentans NRRL YB-2248]|uniref:Importin N-terminal domain-containing protein n=1 Tax=[Candida] arabinofermentans NRRL YB-2248 TaxID=983967 RepID=A0A1E4T299_9ASCO|nr:hypothetical protein CANARDRAFT_27954 [[Candida] arabinofermentans NRRL YB-2248]
MENQLLDILQKLGSSDNALRQASEEQFRALISSQSSESLYTLATIALNQTLEPAFRQASLLHLKRFVPNYWTPAFDSYIGPNTIEQPVKQFIRESLIKLIGDHDSKIRNSASYAIVQIAAVDYPDEWPSLMNDLYGLTTDLNSSAYQILGSLIVLRELIDDTVTDEQLFQDGIGINVLQTCERLLTDDSYSLSIKTETMRLLNTVLLMIDNSDFRYEPKWKPFVKQVTQKIMELLTNTLSGLSSRPELYKSIIATELRHELYNTLDTLADSFSNRFSTSAPELVKLVIFELSNVSELYPLLISAQGESSVSSIFYDTDEFKKLQTNGGDLVDTVIQQIAVQITFLSAMFEISTSGKQPHTQPEILHNLVECLIPLSCIPHSTLESYYLDFNEFVTQETTDSPGITARNEILTFLSEINAQDNMALIEMLVNKFNNALQSNYHWTHIESIAFLISSLCSNDADVEAPSFDVSKLLELIINLISAIVSQPTNENQFLAARYITLIPNLIMKYQSFTKELAIPALDQIVSMFSAPQLADGFDALKCSVLISLQFFRNFLETSEFDSKIQFRLIELINDLKDDVQEDTNTLLLEALSTLISIDNKALTQNESTLMLTLSIAFNDCSNYLLTANATDCVRELLDQIPLENYLTLCSKGLPALIEPHIVPDMIYSDELFLILQVLTAFIDAPSQSGFEFPSDVFLYLFPIIYKLMITSKDEMVLQSASETFNELLSKCPQLVSKYTSPEEGISGDEMLLKIVSKLLSPELSDEAILKLGDLVVLLIKNFGGESIISHYFEEILKGVTLRLLSAKEMMTIESLILIFNTLAVTEAKSTIDFLANFEVDGRPALIGIIPIWLQSFEIMRGYEKIRSNVNSFIEIYKLNDPRLKSIKVDGDLLPNQVDDDVIITRSMAKKITLNYEQIGADVKVIRLLIGEFKFQVQAARQQQEEEIKIGQQHNDGDVEEEEDNDDDDDDDDGDDWEDLEDVGVPDFEQLQRYVDGDALDHVDGSRWDTSARIDGDIKDELTRFFKECTINNLGGFQEIYTQSLSDEDKKFLTEYVVFT